MSLGYPLIMAALLASGVMVYYLITPTFGTDDRPDAPSRVLRWLRLGVVIPVAAAVELAAAAYGGRYRA